MVNFAAAGATATKAGGRPECGKDLPLQNETESKEVGGHDLTSFSNASNT